MINYSGRGLHVQATALRIQRPFVPRNFVRTVKLRNEASREPTFKDGLAALQAKGTTKLSVTSYITQYDELNQIKEFADEKPKRATKPMKHGTLVHEMLESRWASYLPDIGLDASLLADVRPDALKDIMQLADFTRKVIHIGLNAYSKSGVVRELPMRGLTPDKTCILRGIVDCVYISRKGIVVLETKTTQREVSRSLMRIAYHQALTYHYMLKSLLNHGEEDVVTKVRSLFILDDVPEQVDEFLKHHSLLLEAAVERLKAIGLAPYVNIQILRALGGKNYEEELYELSYDEDVLLHQLQSRADLFTGAREPYAFRLQELVALNSGEPLVVTHDDELPVDGTSMAEQEALRLTTTSAASEPGR